MVVVAAVGVLAHALWQELIYEGWDEADRPSSRLVDPVNSVALGNPKEMTEMVAL